MNKLCIKGICVLLLSIPILLNVGCSKDDDDKNGGKVYTLGETGPAGGIVFYVNPAGGGLEAAPAGWTVTGNDPSASWGCVDLDVEGTSEEIGSGMANTQLIVNACNTENIAAKIANNLVHNGFDDWYLPSIEELMLLYQNSELVVDLSPSWYWSSSQTSPTSAWARHFGIGMPAEGRNKVTASNVRVRPIRTIN
ncbi:MAG: DUF1566 domain-containing protein [Chitinophagaceae bacterium]|nr:MAG: DUF1566 domain-containing protein [Chitinophagaceae bacterium]